MPKQRFQTQSDPPSGLLWNLLEPVGKPLARAGGSLERAGGSPVPARKSLEPVFGAAQRCKPLICSILSFSITSFRAFLKFILCVFKVRPQPVAGAMSGAKRGAMPKSARACGDHVSASSPAPRAHARADLDPPRRVFASLRHGTLGSSFRYSDVKEQLANPYRVCVGCVLGAGRFPAANPDAAARDGRRAVLGDGRHATYPRHQMTVAGFQQAHAQRPQRTLSIIP